MLFLLDSLVLALSSLAAGANAQTLLKFMHSDQQTNVRHLGAQLFAKKVAEYTNNRYKINVFCCGQLGNDQKGIEQLVGGGVDFTVSGTATYAPHIDSLNLVALPFLFDSYEQGWKFYDESKWLKEQYNKAPAKGFRFLSTFEAGFRSITTKKVLNSPADAKGKKLRGSPIEMQRWVLEDIGFVVQILPLPEVYIAIQQGLVDGQDNPIDTIWSNKFYEVAPYVTLTRHVYSPIPVTISEKTWQKLSPEDQKMFVQAAKEAADWTRQEVIAHEEKQIADMVSKGAKINNPDVQPFRDAVKPTLEKARKKYGVEVDTIMAEVTAIRAALPVKK